MSEQSCSINKRSSEFLQPVTKWAEPELVPLKTFELEIFPSAKVKTRLLLVSAADLKAITTCKTDNCWEKKLQKSDT